MRRFLFLIFLFPFTVFADSGADFKSAMQLYSKKAYSASRELLLKVATVEPNNALYRFNLGTARFMLNEYAEAAQDFAQVESSGSSLAPAASLYRAKAIAAGGDPKVAAQILRELLKLPTLPAGLRAEAARDFKAQILALYNGGKYSEALGILKKHKNPDSDTMILESLLYIKLDREDLALKKLDRTAGPEAVALTTLLRDRVRDTYQKNNWLYVDLAAGHDSIVPGTTAQAMVGGGGRLWFKDLWRLNAGYNGFLNENPGHGELQILSHELLLGLRHELGADLFALTPYLLHESWDGKAARLENGIRISWRTGNEHKEYGIEAGAARISDLDSSLEYAAGDAGYLKMFAGKIARPFYTQAFLLLDRKALGSQTYSTGEVVPSAYFGWAPGGRVLWRANPKWAADLSISYGMRSYHGRRDRELDLTARVTRLFDARRSIYLSAAHIHNSSTMDQAPIDQNYSSLQFLIGGLWDAF